MSVEGPSGGGGAGRGRELLLLSAVVAYAFAFAHLHWSVNLVHPPAEVAKLVDFTAETPYQLRVLVPLLLRGLAESGVLAGLGVSLEAAARFLDALAVVGIFYATRALLARFFDDGSEGGNRIGADARRAATRWALLVLWALPFHYLLSRMWPYWYPSDTAAVLFTTLGLLWIRTRNWAAYYWMFPLATLNRESTYCLIAIFALTQLGRMGILALAGHLALQTAIWIALKLLLGWTFARNEGAGAYVEEAWRYNWSLRGDAERWLTLAMVFGFLWIPFALLAPRARDPFVRRAAAFMPIFFVIGYVFAQFDELRVYGEMLPVIVLGVACGTKDRGAPRSGAPRSSSIAGVTGP